MARITAADAIAALMAAGHSVSRISKAQAARRFGCQTALYVINGRGVNLGGLRAQAQALEVTPEVTPEPTQAPEATPEAQAPEAQAQAPARASLATLARAMGQDLGLAQGGHLPAAAHRAIQRPAPASERPAPRPAWADPMAGQPWDPGTPEARARVALQGERAAILWPVARALAGAGVALPASWASDGPAMAGQLTLAEALARLPLGAIAQAAAALAALPPVTPAQDAALALCRTGAVPGRPYL
ncbi:MAG: hypothetical protein VKK63_05575 [Synechococcus sp.]|nr:hypothetical protein [Synechococcus sp.]